MPPEPSTTPLPTPYDISAIPVFAYEPDWRVWTALAALTLVLAAVLFIWNWRIRKRQKFESALRCARRDIAAIARAALSGQLSKEQVAQFSLVLRRLLSVVSGRDFSAMSPNELIAETEAKAGSPNGRVLGIILRLEEDRFRPGSLTLNCEYLAREAQEALLSLEQELTKTKTKGRSP